jgi:hypothetical protein
MFRLCCQENWYFCSINWCNGTQCLHLSEAGWTTFCCLKVSKHIIETHHWQVQINLHDQWICQDLISLKMYLSLWLFPFYRQEELVLKSRLLWWLAQYHATRLGSCNWEAAAARSIHGTVKLVVLHCCLTEICKKSFKGFGSQGLGYTGSLTDGVTWWWVWR